jgi:hypothetical protein
MTDNDPGATSSPTTVHGGTPDSVPATEMPVRSGTAAAPVAAPGPAAPASIVTIAAVDGAGSAAPALADLVHFTSVPGSNPSAAARTTGGLSRPGFTVPSPRADLATRRWDAWDPRGVWVDIQAGDAPAYPAGSSPADAAWWAGVSRDPRAALTSPDLEAAGAAWLDTPAAGWNDEGLTDFLARALENGHWPAGPSTAVALKGQPGGADAGPA